MFFETQCTTNHAERRSNATHLLLGGAWEDYSPVVMCTRRQSICYPYSRHPLQAQAPLNLSVMACHSLEKTGGPSVPVREFNLTACPIAQLSWKTLFQTWILTQTGESPQPVRPAGTVAYSVV